MLKIKSIALAGIACASLMLSSCGSTPPSSGDAQSAVYNSGEDFLLALNFADTIAIFTHPSTDVCKGVQSFSLSYTGAENTVRNPAFSGDQWQQAQTIAANAVSTIITIFNVWTESTPNSSAREFKATSQHLSSPPSSDQWQTLNTQIEQGISTLGC